MKNIRFGYGSEYQLLRFLGYHRNALEAKIKDVTGSNSPIHWLDFPHKEGTSYQDREYFNVEFLKNEPFYHTLVTSWKRFWPTRGNSQNWDAVFHQDNTWYIVEAKAHLSEAHKRCKAKEQGGRSKILKAFADTCNGNTEIAQQWLDSNCYQLANRLAFIHFCRMHNISARLLLICFISGFGKYPNKEVADEITWNNLWEEEFNELSLNDAQKNDILKVYVDCKND